MDDKLLEILVKELDLLDNTISRLDKQIQTSKNICITLWTAWLGWFLTKESNLKNGQDIGIIVMFSIVFPLLFWLIDYQYRKALLTTSKRQSIISLYINANNNRGIIENISNLPILDPVGWLYKHDVEDLIDKCRFELTADKKKFLLAEKIRWSNILFYKEAKWFYFPLIIITIGLGLYFYCKTNFDAIALLALLP